MQHLVELNAPQREAVMTLSGPLLVLAGAGTGKTRVITYRMAELIRGGISPGRILSVTFTNKAAREMQERTQTLLGKRLKQKPMISTFHSLCVKILRQEISHLGYPLNFVIYDRGDQESAARTALRDVRIGEGTLRPGDLINRISRWKTAGVSSENAKEYTDSETDFLAAVAYRKYQANLRASGAVDFDDLLSLTEELFKHFPDVLHRQQARFDHVQIDEYQDTNAAQFTLMEALVRPHKNLCVVGDDDQSIYGWRGAEVEHILNFQSHFPGAKVVRLEDNYRCTDRILELANRLVKHNKTRHEKVLRPHKTAKSDVRCFVFDDETIEAQAIVGEIADLIQKQGVPPEEIAILFRTNEQPRVFESELRRKRVPYVLLGGQSFFDRREIRDILAYLKVMAQPQDEISLLRIINVPARGIGTTTTEKLLKRAVQERMSLWEAIPRAIEAGEVPAKAALALAEFRKLLNRYRARFEEQPKQMAPILQGLIEEIDYESEIEKQYKEPQQQLIRSAMVEQCVDALRDYAERAADPTLLGFLEDSALTGQDEDRNEDDLSKEKGIRLMTIHSAKGLEFPHVYLIGLEEGLLPHQRAVDANEAAIDEERRLAYVGITRAMDHLTLSRAAHRTKWGKRRPTTPSRFLFEMR